MDHYQLCVQSPWRVCGGCGSVVAISSCAQRAWPAVFAAAVCVCEGARARTRVFTGVVCLSVCRPVYACSPCQPVYHSKHNDVEARMLCGMSMLPLKKGPRGPAGTLSEGACKHRACIAPRAALCCLVVAVVGGVRVVLL